MDLTGMAVSVIAYNQPDYLYITLDALSRVPRINEFPVTVYFDGGISDELFDKQNKVLNEFPLVSRSFSDKHIGILGNVTRGIRSPIECGARSVLYIEDDHLVRPDVLEFPMRDKSGCFFIGLSFQMQAQLCKYVPKGNIVSAQNAIRLLEWVDEKRYIGMRKAPGNPDDLIDEHYTGHDFIFNAFMRAHGLKTSFPDGLYLAHIGLFGTNFPKNHATPDNLIKLEQKMLAGPKEKWLDNVVNIMKSGDYPFEPTVLNARLWPRGFSYYGKVSKTTL